MFLPRMTACALALALLPGAARAADDAAAEVARCIEAVGSYVTLRVNHVDGEDRLGRSLLSLTNGGHAFLADSAEGGIYGYQPFTGGAGAWRCLSADGGTERFRAVILDFTFGTDSEPDQAIARLDIEASYDVATGAIEGTTALRFLPLSADPMDVTKLGEAATYAFTGTRITVPEQR